MNEFRNSRKREQRLEEFINRRKTNLGQYLERLYQASEDAVWQHAQAASAPPTSDHSESIDGTCFVIGSGSDGLYRQELKRIEELRQAVFSNDPRILGAWALAVICAYYSRYLLALNLLGLAGILFYLKFVRAAQIRCPNCQQPFGSAQSLPTRLGGDSCQQCGLSIKAMR